MDVIDHSVATIVPTGCRDCYASTCVKLPHAIADKPLTDESTCKYMNTYSVESMFHVDLITYKNEIVR